MTNDNPEIERLKQSIREAERELRANANGHSTHSRFRHVTNLADQLWMKKKRLAELILGKA